MMKLEKKNSSEQAYYQNKEHVAEVGTPTKDSTGSIRFDHK